MTTEQYLSYRTLRKTAAAAAGAAAAKATALSILGTKIMDLLGKGATKAADATAKVATKGISLGTKVSLASLPALGLTGAWLAYKTTSPEAVADNLPEYAKNAMEKESIVQSLRDLESMQMNKQISGKATKAHDQFL